MALRHNPLLAGSQATRGSRVKMSHRTRIQNTWWDEHWPTVSLHQYPDLLDLNNQLRRHTEDFKTIEQGSPDDWLLIRVQPEGSGPVTEMSLRSNSWVSSSVVDSNLKSSILERLETIDTEILPARYLIRRDPVSSGQLGNQHYAMLPYPTQGALSESCSHCRLIIGNRRGWFYAAEADEDSQVELYIDHHPLYNEAFKFRKTLCPFHWRWLLTGQCLSSTQCLRLNEIAGRLASLGSSWSQAHDERVRRWAEEQLRRSPGPREQTRRVRETVRKFGIRELAARNRSEANKVKQPGQGNRLLADLVRQSVPDRMTDQEEFDFSFPSGAMLLYTAGDGPWHALALSIENQIPSAQRHATTIVEALAEIYQQLSPMNSDLLQDNTSIIEQMVQVAQRYLEQFGLRRRVGFVRPSAADDNDDRQMLVARIHTHPDKKDGPVLWIHLDDRLVGQYANCRYHGVCAANPASFPPYEGDLGGEAHPPSDGARADHPGDPAPATHDHMADSKAHAPAAAAQPSNGSSHRAEPGVAPANQDDGPNDEAASAAAAASHGGGVPAGVAQANDRHSGPLPNKPTTHNKPAPVCWNCGGRGHHSRKYLVLPFFQSESPQETPPPPRGKKQGISRFGDSTKHKS